MSSSSSSHSTSFKYCNCLNIRVTLTCPETKPSDETINPDFQWCWLTTNQGVYIEHGSLTLRHHWDENWIALRCLNCDLDVYAYDTTDSIDSSEPLRPILFNKRLKSDKDAELIRQPLSSHASSVAQSYSPAFKIIISSSSKNIITSLNPLPSSITTTNLSDFQKQIDLLMEGYIKGQETAMQLRIEEFREEQQRLLESQVNAAKLAASRLFKVAEVNQPPVQSGIKSLFSNSSDSNGNSNNDSSGDSNAAELPQDSDFDDDSDTEDFSLPTQSIPIQQVSDPPENSEYLSSSFNEDIFDLDEDYSRSVSSIPAQDVIYASLRSDTESNNFIAGSFAAQGRYFPSNAPKYIPDSPTQSPGTQRFEEVSNMKSTDEDLSDMIFSSSLPISIHTRKQASHGSKLKPEQPVAFEAPHELASRTFVNDKDQLFGGVPRSVTHRLGI